MHNVHGHVAIWCSNFGAGTKQYMTEFQIIDNSTAMLFGSNHESNRF